MNLPLTIMLTSPTSHFVAAMMCCAHAVTTTVIVSKTRMTTEDAP